jgi:hypothetical protein
VGKINPTDFGTSRPKLTQTDFDGDFIILTIAAAEEVTVEDDEKESGERKSLVLTFQETGDKSLWLNVTMIKTLIAEIGDDTDKWAGQKVPVEKYTGSFKGKKFEKVGIMESPWDEAFKDSGVRRTRPGAAPAASGKATVRGKR